MNKEARKVMKVRIVKSILSIYGAMTPGMEITVPEHIAKNWIKNKIAVPHESVVPPKGMFWCIKHGALHKLTSPRGIKCQNRLAKEAEGKTRQEATTKEQGIARAKAAAEAAEAEAEEKARQEAAELEAAEAEKAAEEEGRETKGKSS